MYLAKLLTARSLPEIGRRFGNRDYTTVLHAVRKIEAELRQSQRLKNEIEHLKMLIAPTAPPQSKLVRLSSERVTRARSDIETVEGSQSERTDESPLEQGLSGR